MRIEPIPIATASLAAMLMASPVTARPMAPPADATPAAVKGGGAACDGGVVLDDGTAETGYGWIPSVVEGEYVQRFDSPRSSTTRLESVCVCWQRTGADSTVDFEVVFYRDASGRPADSPYATVASSAEVTPVGIVETFFEVEIRGIDLAPGAAYVGLRWNPSVDSFFFICADSSDGTEPVAAFFRDDRAGGEWASALDTPDPIFANHRAMMVRLRSRIVTVLDVPALSGDALALFAMLLAAVGFAALARIGSSSRERSCYNVHETRARDGSRQAAPDDSGDAPSPGDPRGPAK